MALSKKTEKCVFTFESTADAMNMEKHCKECAIAGRIIPVPTSITAGCGLAWCADINEKENILKFIEKTCLKYQGVYSVFLR